MKIAVIATLRTRSTLLVEILRAKYPHLQCFYEIYTYHLTDGISVPTTTEILSKADDFIVKIMANNLFDANTSDLKLQGYDDLYFIERHDFFEQCCSLEIASVTDKWVQWKDNTEPQIDKRLTFNLSKSSIVYNARCVNQYLKIKSDVFSSRNKIFEYNDDAIVSGKIDDKRIILPTNLNYSTMFKNYELKSTINSLFNNHFNYALMTSDFIGFVEALNNVLE
jgi:hypothetical protein